MRTPHYWRKGGAAATPSNMLVVDVETWHGERARVEGGELHTLRLGCALAYRLEHGKRTRVQSLTFTHADEFWHLAEQRLDQKRPLWIWAHNANYDLGILNAWSVICGEDFETDKAALSNTMVWVTGKWKGRPVVFCDTMNYYHSTLASVGAAVGIKKQEMPEQREPDSVWEVYCRNDVDITAAAIDSLCQFVRTNELGPWGPSIASLSFHAYRTRYMRHKVLVHNNQDALKAERESYHGGIVATNFVGRVPTTPVYEVDVCSMFPAMACKQLPVKLLGDSDRMSAAHLATMVDDLMLCARVRIETDEPCYPVETTKGTYYPVGKFTTCLSHPELVHALKAGRVKWVEYVAWYTRGSLFKGYMTNFVSLKSEYRSKGNEAFATLCKYYANNLYGKTGQQSPQWRDWNAETLTVIEQQRGLPEGSLSKLADPTPDIYMREETIGYPELGVILKIRNYWGRVEVQCEPAESRDSCPIIASCITGYARLYLRKCQAICGARNWFYSDTDSLWVNVEGLENLKRANLIANDVLGKLSMVREHEWLIVNGNKDYETNLVVKLKGIRRKAIRGSDGRYTQDHFPSATAQMRQGTKGAIKITSVTKSLSRRIDRCHVGPDGWTRPLEFPRDVTS